MKTQKTKSVREVLTLLPLIFCFSLLIFGSAFSQTSTPGWHFINPSPAPFNNLNYLYSAYFFNDNLGYAVGDRGYVYRTTDGGYIWNIIQLTPGTTNYKILFTSNTVGFVFGLNGNIQKTTNGGFNWALITSGTTQTIRSAYYVSPNTIYAVGGSSGTNSLILKSTDGGTTWNTQTSPVTQNLNSVYFIDANTGVAAGNNGTILRTSNGGTNWTLRASGTNVALNSVSFKDNSNAFACGETSTLLFSTDAGLNWGIGSGVTGNLKVVKFKNSTEGYLGGFSSQYRTVNGGSTWSPITMFDYPYDIAFPVSGNYYYSVGNYNNRGVSVSTNGGTNWTDLARQNLSSSQFTDVIFTTDNNGFVAASDFLYSTTNTGYNWNYTGVNGCNSLTINGSRGCAVGDGGKISISSNSGVSWTQQTIGTNDYFGVAFFDPNTGITVGNTGTVLRTANGGVNWLVRTSGTAQPLRAVDMITSQIAIAVGDGGTAIKSTDGGDNWFDLTTGTTFNLKDIKFVDANNAFIVGNGGILLRTTNAGTTWTPITTSTSQSLNSIDFIGSSGGIAGNGGTIFLSNNSGATWTLQNSITVNNLNGITMPTSNTWYIAGDSATILQTKTSGNVIGINYSNLLTPEKYSLSQNYPNPFNPTTKIKFDITESGLVKLSVYDMLGRVVETLVNDNLSIGSYEKDFNASKLTSGVYFYKLEVGEYTEVKKMTLVK